MKLFLKRVCIYSTLVICGFYLKKEIMYREAARTEQKSKELHDAWEAKRVLFGTGLLSPEEMRTLCLNKTLLSTNTDYPLLHNDPLHTIKPTYYLSDKYNMLVCSVPKAGSTFWTSTMAAITGVDAEVTDSLPKGKNLQSAFAEKMRVNYEEVKKTFTGYKVITTRNPYSRLFSAYLEYVFLPTNWQLSEKIKDQVKGRFSFDEPEHFCLDELTFSDFLMFVTNSYNAYSNAYWMPIINLCESCDNVPVLIVQEENFASDVKRVLKKVGIVKTRIDSLTSILEPNSTEQTLSIVQKLLNKSFQNTDQYCLSSTEILQRIWTSLQIQGRITSNSEFPRKLHKGKLFETTLKFKFKKAVKLEIGKMTPERQENQRNTALIGIYKTVHPGIIESIRKIYYSDFVIFNYSVQAPTALTQKHSLKSPQKDSS